MAPAKCCELANNLCESSAHWDSMHLCEAADRRSWDSQCSASEMLPRWRRGCAQAARLAKGFSEVLDAAMFTHPYDKPTAVDGVRNSEYEGFWDVRVR